MADVIRSSLFRPSDLDRRPFDLKNVTPIIPHVNMVLRFRVNGRYGTDSRTDGV